MVVCCLCSCKTSAGVTKEKISNDIISSEAFAGKFENYTLIDFEIYNRMLDKENGTDTFVVHMSLDSKDKSVTCWARMDMEYVLRDKVWELEKCEFSETDFGESEQGIYCKYKPLTGLVTNPFDDPNFLESCVDANGGTLSVVSGANRVTDLKEGKDTFTLILKEHHKYVVYEYEVVVSSLFDFGTGRWSDADYESRKLLSQEWDITGKYDYSVLEEYSNGGYHRTNYVLDIDDSELSENMTVTLTESQTWSEGDNNARGERGTPREFELQQFYDMTLEAFESEMVNTVLKNQDYNGSPKRESSTENFKYKVVNGGYSVVIDRDLSDFDCFSYDKGKAGSGGEGSKVDVLFFFGPDNIAFCIADDMHWSEADDYEKTYTYRVVDLEQD